MTNRPRTVVLLFFLTHVVVWTLLPTLLFPNAPLDVIENLTWGREWELGYYKQPPLQAWLCEAVTTLSGGGLWAVYLAAQMTVALSFYGVWRLARTVTDPVRAALAVICLEAIFFYTYTSPILNANVLQIAAWALCGWLFWRAYRSARVSAWALFGAVVGVAALGKYFIVVQLIAMGVFLVFDREGRRQLRGPGPYFAAVVCLLVMTPHLVWLVRHDFIAIVEAAGRTQATTDLVAHVWRPVQFAASQLAAVAVLLGVFAFVFGRRGFVAGGGWSSFADAATRRYLLLLCFCPFVVLVVLAAIMGARMRTMWGAPLWCFLPLLLLVRQPEITRRHLHRFAGAVSATAAVWILLFVAQYGVVPAKTGRHKRVHFPGHDLAASITEQWREATGRPLAFVVGEPWYAGNVAFYSPDRPSVFLRANGTLSPWIDDETIRAAGAAVVWSLDADEVGPPRRYSRRFRGWIMQEPLTFEWRRTHAASPIRIGWAIFDPELRERLKAEAAARRRAELRAEKRRIRRGDQQSRAPVGWNVTTP